MWFEGNLHVCFRGYKLRAPGSPQIPRWEWSCESLGYFLNNQWQEPPNFTGPTTDLSRKPMIKYARVSLLFTKSTSYIFAVFWETFLTTKTQPIKLHRSIGQILKPEQKYQMLRGWYRRRNPFEFLIIPFGLNNPTDYVGADAFVRFLVPGSVAFVSEI